jgi:alkanesulfonate monooxygenase SsuD/methylene tetrahydromethanopterin reductase-like flavin-dependent oxidoreductase (luciferase family)
MGAVPDYGRTLEFGANVDPTAEDIPLAREVAAVADARGLELVGVQDHPYQRRFLDTFVLMSALLAETERVRVFPNVANLPLRGPAMIAKAAASLDVLSGGRFELGLGAGSFWEAIGAMGGPVRSPGEAVDALEEAVRIVRLFWSGERSITFEGRYYAVKGLHPGPPPVHPIGIWLGAYKPRMLALTGRLADGWSVSLSYAPPEQVPALQARIDEAAAEAGRDPSEIRRLANVSGSVDDAARWAEELTRFALDLGLDTFVFWPAEDHVRQLERFAGEVVPAVREAVERERG